MINLTIPVYNEEKNLEEKILQVDNFLVTKNYGSETFILIADNNSNDRTQEISKKLTKTNNIKTIYYRIAVQGKGNAIRESWQKFSANQYWFMDLDLSTDLKHLDELYSSLQNFPVVIGSRFLPESQTKRCIKREVTSRGYNFLLECLFDKKFKDAQCGFKGVTNEIVEKIIPLTRSNGYFFDSELLLLSEINKYAIKEIPVSWVEDRNSNVNLLKVIPLFLRKMYEHKKRMIAEPGSVYI